MIKSDEKYVNNNENKSQQETIIECKECGLSFRKDLFARHVKYHMTYESYILKWNHNNQHPLCKCGCGQETNWNDKIKDFDEHFPGCLEAKKFKELGIKPPDILDIPQPCALCGFQTKGRKSLAMHVASKHLDVKVMSEYVKIVKFNGRIPLCKCGCGKEVKWASGAQRYNEYINAHNEVGFKVAQPNFSKEQIKNRNDKIRKAYIEKGDEIREKISKSVNAAFANPEIQKSRKIDTKSLVWYVNYAVQYELKQKVTLSLFV